MIKKTISAACAVLLTLASASCQKSDVDLCLDAQTELVETLQKINDRDSADKYADVRSKTGSGKSHRDSGNYYAGWRKNSRSGTDSFARPA